MAVYNEARHLALALDALCAQTFRDLHLAVYDDGSTDGSAALVEGYLDRLPLKVIRGAHLGRHFAKQAAWAQAAEAPYLLVLDADIVVPPDALERMVEALDLDPAAAAVSASYRAETGRPYGRVQAFLDDVFFDANRSPAGEGRWIVGACVLLRRSALEGVVARSDLGEDHDLSEKLRPRWRLLQPLDLVAVHRGVPSTLTGIVRRFDREGVRVRALHRAYPGARQWTSLVRLVPLALLAATLAAAAMHPRAAALTGMLLLGYVAAFAVASRKVQARLSERIAGALVFTIANFGFGVGYLREWLRGASHRMREPERPD